MKKKLIAVFAAVVVSASAGLFATGIGPQLNFDPVATRFITPPAWGLACSAERKFFRRNAYRHTV